MMLANQNAIDAGGYQIANSLRFRAAASAYLSRTIAASANPNAWTWSAWVKRGQLGAASTFVLFAAQISAGSSEESITFLNDTLRWGDGSAGISGATTAVYRDTSAWYHVQVVYDSANATAANRLLFYVNGVLSAAAGASIAQNRNSFFTLTATNPVAIGRYASINSNHFDGYLSEINFIDGQALGPSNFGQTDPVTGSWTPKKYTGTYGTNGFYLPFNDGSNLTNLCLDRSGNGNNWTATNVSLTAGATYDWLADTPTNNYCTWNPLDSNNNKPTNANLRAGHNAGEATRATFFVNSGKWYFEWTPDIAPASSGVGIANFAATLSSYPGADANALGYGSGGNKNNSGSSQAYGASWGAGDVVSCAFDLDNGKIWWAKNGVWQASGDPAAGTNAAYTGLIGYYAPIFGVDSASGAGAGGFGNFGQRPFAYTPPSGFKSLCTANLPAVSIPNGRKHFDVVTQMGSAVSTGAALLAQFTNFVADFAWGKDRAAANNHQLVDTVRGSAAVLQSNATTAETTYVAPTSGDNCVAWGWKAGGAAVANNAGSIASQVSANTQAGISIVTYTGNGVAGTVGHGLGVVPKMVIAKPRSAVGNWATWHASLVVGNTVWLNVTNASQSVPLVWNSTAPTSSVFSIGATNSDTNTSGVTQVAYCFAEVAGFSRFGSYVGNGVADGPFVWLSMLARFVLIKRTDTTGNWYIWDAARNAFNVVGEELYPNLSNAASTATDLDITSNGFKLRSVAADLNASGGTYVYAAFASNPFGGQNVSPANAR